jgi:hypothetical protein
MDDDLSRKFTSGKDRTAGSAELQKRVEELVGPLHERRATSDRRRVTRISRGRRHTDWGRLRG